MNPQFSLMPLAPSRKLPRLTIKMRLTLDAVELAAGRPLAEVVFNRVGGGKGYAILDKGQAGVLRALIRAGCVEVVSLAPAVYRVTKIGRIVRRLPRSGPGAGK